MLSLLCEVLNPMEDAVRICVNTFVYQNYETIDQTIYEDERTNVMNYIPFCHLWIKSYLTYKNILLSTYL